MKVSEKITHLIINHKWYRRSRNVRIQCSIVCFYFFLRIWSILHNQFSEVGQSNMRFGRCVLLRYITRCTCLNIARYQRTNKTVYTLFFSKILHVAIIFKPKKFLDFHQVYSIFVSFYAAYILLVFLYCIL